MGGICTCCTGPKPYSNTIPQQNQTKKSPPNNIQQTQTYNKPELQMIEQKENVDINYIIKEETFKNFELKYSIEGHQDNIISLIELNNKKIMTASYDKKIKIWNTYNYKCELTIEEEEKIICLIEFEPNIILIGTSSGKINLWNLWDINNIKKEYSFIGHSLSVNCLVKCNENIFASGSNDTDIRIWDYSQKQCINILKGHHSNIFCLIKLNNNKLCSGSADKTLRIWNWKQNDCEMILKGHNSWVKSICQLKNGNIISGSDDNSIIIWNNNYIKEKELKGHQGSIKSLCNINDKYFASGSFDKTIKIWDINNEKCMQTLYEHKDKVICVLYHSNGYLISCSNDKTIKFWKQEEEQVLI